MSGDPKAACFLFCQAQKGVFVSVFCIWVEHGAKAHSNERLLDPLKTIEAAYSFTSGGSEKKQVSLWYCCGFDDYGNPLPNS